MIMVLGCLWHVLLLATASSSELTNVDGRAALQPGAAEAQGHTATPSHSRQHAAPPQPAAAAPDDSEAAASSPASLPLDIVSSAERGQLPKVFRWLGEGGAIDALCPITMNGQNTTTSLLLTATSSGHLEMVRELLNRGASVDLPNTNGSTALMYTAVFGHHSILLLLLQHSANPDLQDVDGFNALMRAAIEGHEACVQALLRAKANTELIENKGRTALQWAEDRGHTAIAALLRQQASRRALGLGVALCAVLPPTWPWVELSVVLGAIGVVAIRRTLTARIGQDRAARQRRPHRHARHAKAQGETSTEEPSRQHAAPPQPAAAASSRARQAARATRGQVLGGSAAHRATPTPSSRSPGEPSRAAGRGGRDGRGVPSGGSGDGRGGGSGVGGDGGAGPSSQAVLALADAGDITGRAAVPESTVGGETTCIVCMARPKSHVAVPCGHQCVCAVCAERMQDCPYCRAPAQQWVHARVV